MPPPFPESPEEAAWLARRETLILTVLGQRSGWLVLLTWIVGGEERTDRQELGAGALDAWAADVEARGGWKLAAFARSCAGDGFSDFEHEAYEYHDHDPDSLDLDSWRPPRRWRIERSRDGAQEAESQALLGAYARFLPERLRAASPFALAFGV